MYKALLFLLAHLAHLTAIEAAKGELTATNGGIIQQGETLTLSYKVEEPWEDCYWYRQGQNEKERGYCKFTAGQTKPSCKPKTLKDHMKFNAVDNLTCSIIVEKVDESDNVTWSARVDADFDAAEINVMVAIQPKNITIKAKPMVAGKFGNVSCLISGGRPAPLVSYNFEDIPGLSSPEVNSTMTQPVDDKGIYTTENVVLIKPTAKDHDRVFSCKAVQKAEDKELFEPLEAKTKLNVTFPPLPREDGQGTQENPMAFGTEVGEDLKVVVKFFANPRPDSVEWKFKGKQDAEGGDSNGTVVLAGTSNDHYVASDLADDEGKKNYYVAKLTIKKLQVADHAIRHSLVVRNTVGAQVYHYTVELGKVTTTTTSTTVTTTTTTKPTTTSKPSGGKDNDSGVIYAVVVICIVLVLVAVGIFIFRKWKRNRTETAPLRQTN